MKRLARSLNKSLSGNDNLSLPTIDDARPIDTEEQEKLVRELEEMYAHQSRIWRGVFATLLVCYMAFILFNIYHISTSDPWQLRYHAYFLEEIHPAFILSSDCWTLMMCISALIHLVLWNSKQHRRRLLYLLFGGFIFAVVWLYHMLRLPKFRWDVIWLPFGPPSVAGMCLYLEHLLNESSEELRKLRSYMYAYKAS